MWGNSRKHHPITQVQTIAGFIKTREIKIPDYKLFFSKQNKLELPLSVYKVNLFQEFSLIFSADFR